MPGESVNLQWLRQVLDSQLNPSFRLISISISGKESFFVWFQRSDISMRNVSFQGICLFLMNKPNIPSFPLTPIPNHHLTFFSLLPSPSEFYISSGKGVSTRKFHEKNKPCVSFPRGLACPVGSVSINSMGFSWEF